MSEEQNIPQKNSKEQTTNSKEENVNEKNSQHFPEDRYTPKQSQQPEIYGTKNSKEQIPNPTSDLK